MVAADGIAGSDLDVRLHARRRRAAGASRRTSPSPPRVRCPARSCDSRSLTPEPASDSIVGVAGTMAGEPLHFVGARGVWRAIGAVPVDSGGEVVARVIASRASGRTDTLSASVTPPPLPPPKEQLAVAEQFGRPMDSATAARVERENAARARRRASSARVAAASGRAPFQRPRASEISSGFGTGRTFNGQVASRHLGVDFRGALGAPIRAANGGVVVLVDTFFLGGRRRLHRPRRRAHDRLPASQPRARRRRRHRRARSGHRPRRRDRPRDGTAPALDRALRRAHGEPARPAHARAA